MKIANEDLYDLVLRHITVSALVFISKNKGLIIAAV